jgi:membrane associated rhomboid family serine protease
VALTGRDPGGTVRPRRQWPLLLVVAGVLGGLVSAFLGPATWRPGCVVVGSSLVLGALLRLVLPTRAAGLLQVRGKAFDVVVVLLTGAAIIALAVVVPPAR